MSSKRAWISHGFWNTAEHAVTRASDAGLTLLLIWSLPVEIFSRIVLAQAILTPALFFFFSPGWALYHGYSRWKAAGSDALAFRLYSLRRFGEALAVLALAITAVAAFALDAGTPWIERWSAMVWAMSLAAGPAILAADRELLRLELKFGALNWLTVVQKAILLLGTMAVTHLNPGRLLPLAGVAIVALALSAMAGRLMAVRLVPSRPAQASRELLESWLEIFKEFSLWNHLTGLIIQWLQSLDVFFLGLFGAPARVTGLYGVGLKIGNFALALPQALGSLLLVRVGRGVGPDRSVEWRRVGKAVAGIAAFILTQNLVIVVLSPWILHFLSKGRWEPAELAQIRGWLGWILSGTWCAAVGYLLFIWLQIQASARQVLLRVYVPTLALALGIYALAAWAQGPSGVACANFAVGGLLLGLLLVEFVRSR